MTDRHDPLTDWSTYIEPLAPRPGEFETIRRGARRRRRMKAVTTASIAAVFVGAVSFTATQFVHLAQPSPDLPVASATPHPSPRPSPRSTTPSVPAAPIHPRPSGASASGPPAVQSCLTGDLAVTRAQPAGGGAAGSSYEYLVFTNTSNGSCTLSGYPRVAFVAGDAGTQVNTFFDHSPDTSHTFTLKPGGAVHATVQLPNPDNFGADCQKTAVRGYRVYPPGDTKAVFVSSSQDGCAAHVAVPQVSAIRAGSGD